MTENSEVLSVSMRPRTLSGLYGQEAVVKAIRQHIAKRPPRSWMFHGSTGTGKTTLARIMSVSLQCTHMKLWGDPCEACWRARDSFAIHEINAAKTSGVEELERVVELSRYKPTNPDGKRVIILDEAQKISNAANNLLLKPTEEPPATTVWIICTSEPNKIIPTLRRRFTTYQLKSLTIDGSEQFLAHYAKKAGITRTLEPLYEQCHVMQLYSPALLLQALEKYAAGASASEAAAGIDTAEIDSLRICKAVTGGNWNTVSANLKQVTPDHVRWVRMSVMGWLKGCLARAENSSGQERAAAGILDLSQMPFDDTVLVPWLWATLNRVTRRYGAR